MSGPAWSDPASMTAWTARYLEWLRIRHYSERTVITARKHLSVFVAWSEARAIARPEEVTKPILERYQRHLFHYRKANGRPLSYGGQMGRLVAIRGFFKWLTRQNVILWNPASELELPRKERRLPRNVLTASEVERVLALPDVALPLGLRDRALLETLYATGIRRAELVALDVWDVDAERETVTVRHGKGNKDRVVPLGERALAWITKYHDVRADLVVGDEGALFVSRLGERLSPDWATDVVRKYVRAAELGKEGSCHLFRHTMATLMLEGGADVRFVQEMLGHTKLETTQIYTRVSITKLQEVHTLTHPGARLRGAKGVNRSPAREENDVPTANADELLLSLAAEAADEDGVTP